MYPLIKENLKEAQKVKYMTEEDFLKFCDEDNRAEFIDGDVIVHSPTSNKHGRISMFISSIVQFYVDQHGLGTVWGENFQVRLRSGLRRVPDLIFVSKMK